METKGGNRIATPALDGLEAGIEALAAAAAQLELAKVEIEKAKGPATKADLHAEEVADVLVRVRAERERLAARLPRA